MKYIIMTSVITFTITIGFSNATVATIVYIYYSPHT